MPCLKASRDIFCRCCFPHHEHEHEDGVELLSPKAYTYVAERYESLDCEYTESALLAGEQARKDYSYIMWINLKRGILFVCGGILTGICGAFIEININYFGGMKYSFLRKCIEGGMNPVLFSLLWFSLVFIPVLLGSLIVVFIEPIAAGGGIQFVIGYLNGIRVPRAVKFRVLYVKTLSVTLMIISGFAGGKEGPLIHIGAAAACCITSFRIPGTNIIPFRCFQQDYERRDFIGAGVASGIAAAFGTPIGGGILSMEEGLRRWSPRVMSGIFISALFSGFTYILLLQIYERIPGDFQHNHLLFLSGMDKSTFSYKIYEIPFYIGFGIVGGILGSAWNGLQTCLIFFRQKYVKTKLSKLVEIFVFSVITAGGSLFFIYFVKDGCSGVSYHDKEHSGVRVQINCKGNNTFDPHGIFTFQPGAGILRWMTREPHEKVPMKTLLGYTIFYFFLSASTMGTSVAAGIFIPNLVVGSLWGRSIGTFLKEIMPEKTDWIHTRRLAFIGAVAQLSGVIRISFSLAVIWTEACGNTAFSIPVFLTLFVARWVGNLFNEPMYEKQCHVAGLPLLQDAGPDLDVSAMNVMTKEPVVFLKIVSTVREIYDTITNTKHNGFPVVDPSKTSTEEGIKSVGELKGLILKSQIMVILKRSMYNTAVNELLPASKKLKYFCEDMNSRLALKDSDVNGLNMNANVDLTPYMNQCPYFVHMSTSLYRTYNIFTKMCLRHLMVVNSSGEVVGVVTRKDLSVYRVEQTCDEYKIVKLRRK